MDSRLGRRKPDHTTEGFQGHSDAVAKVRPTAVADLPDLQPWTGKLVSKKAKPREDRSPAVRAHFHAQNLNRENIPRPSTFHVDRPARRVYLLEVEALHSVDPGPWSDLAPRRIGNLERELGARSDGHHWCSIIRPVQLDLADDIVDGGPDLGLTPLVSAAHAIRLGP